MGFIKHFAATQKDKGNPILFIVTAEDLVYMGTCSETSGKMYRWTNISHGFACPSADLSECREIWRRDHNEDMVTYGHDTGLD